MAATADGLGLESLAGQLRGRVPEPESQVSKPPLLRGRRYGFIGDSDALVEVRERALACGAPQVKNIPKTVRWVAVDDPEGQTRHHAAARKLDLPIVSADEASMLLAEDIEAAERKRAQREELMAVREVQAEQRRQDKAAREAERNEYWRPKWRRRERKADPGPRR